MSLLTKDQILGADDLPTKDIFIEEWGGTVRIRCLTGAERDAFEGDVTSTNGSNVTINYRNMRAKLLARCLVGEDGRRLFKESEVVELGKKSSKVITRLFDEARKLSGMTAEDVEELAGNSGSALSGASISGSPEISD